MNYSAAHYRDLANYDTLVLPLQASIAPLIGDGLERWYINQVIRQTYLAVTRVGFMCCTSTSAGGVMLQVLPPRPVSPVGRPVRPILDEFGCSLPPTPRRRSKLNILRRVRPVLLAMRAARATYFAAAWVQYEQMLRRAADPFAAQAARLKQCAEHLLSLKSPLNIIAAGQTPDQVGRRSELPSGQRYYFPLGWPVGEIAKLLAEIQLFDKLHREFEANVLVQPLEIHAAPATTKHPHPGSLALDTPQPTIADEWPDLLRPRVLFTLTNLDQLLAKVGLLNDVASRMPTPDFKGSAVLGVVAALRERRYLLLNDNAKLARILAERYGSDAANPNTIARGTDRLPGGAKPLYTRTLALLPAP